MNITLFDLLDYIAQDALSPVLAVNPPGQCILSSSNGQPQETKKTVDPDFYALPKDQYGFFCPKVSRVIFNGNATVVMFADGTKSTVVKEPNDNYDRTTAIAYAIVKRLLATAANTKTNAVNANYINVIHDLVANGYDQEKAEAEKAKHEANAQAQHEARQKALQEKAFKRRVKNRVRELTVERAAQEALKSGKCNCHKKQLNESVGNESMTAEDFFADDAPLTTVKAKPLSNGTTRTSGLVQIDPKDAWKLYRRPDKPFSQFTDQEKKEYWAYHNAKRRANKQR